MNEVVASKAVPWLVTPDQAVVWGVAFGLHDEIEEVLSRSMEDLEAGRAATNTYMPLWYYGGAGNSLAAGSGGPSGIAPGLFSGSAIPDFGGLMSALGTIGNSPSSSGSGGGGSGGFSGGGSGGGSGAGGGF